MLALRSPISVLFFLNFSSSRYATMARTTGLKKKKKVQEQGEKRGKRCSHICAGCWPVPLPIHAPCLTMALCPASFLNPSPVLCVMDPISTILCVCMHTCLPVWNMCTAYSLAEPARGHWADRRIILHAALVDGEGKTSRVPSPMDSTTP